MNSILKPLKEDLKSLFEDDVIQSAKNLNNNFKTKLFGETQPPMYFNGKFDAKTVFVMLNPGSASDNSYSFKKSAKHKYSDLNNLYEKHIFENENYGELDSGRMDNFDLKQAAFLYEFKDSGLNLSDFFDLKNNQEHSKSIRLNAKKEVLMNKLQLELIPYCSSEFKGLLENSKQALNNIDILIPHIERVLDTIISHKRKYVIFGAKQFYFLFKAYDAKRPSTIIFYGEQNAKIKELENKVYWQIISIKHKEEIINALIPYSFPRKDLPNAYNKMREFGKLCFNDYKNHLDNLITTNAR
jgi:hypothetical protein